jgi:ribosomal protein L7Ae-like RNA K-turn-binding protein
MGVSTAKVVLLCLFLFLGMVLPGLLMQPEASLQVWDVLEDDFPINSSSEEKLTFLLNYAILAPSNYNSQPWLFNISDGEIQVLADKSAWLKVADADRREQYISLGCALENLIIAAEHFGYNCSVSYLPGPERLVATVSLTANSSSLLDSDSRLFYAITSRQTNRNPYETKTISETDLETIKSLCSDPDVGVFIADDPAVKKSFLDLVVEADGILYSNVNYKSELGRWLGLGVMGPTGLQAKIAQMEVVFLDVGPEQTKKDALLINSTPYIGFISTANNDSISSVKAGRILERFWLGATALGISLHPMSQALEVAETKENLTGLLPGSSEMRQVQQAFRLGYAESATEHSTRRPLQEVLISE